MTREGTKSGVLLGTVPYMSPEQARRKSIDQRTDIWAFGCVLFETVTAKNCFLGETITDTLAAVVRAEPDWTALPAMVPAKLRDLLMRCVKKDPRQRLQHVGDARIAIDEALEESAGPVPVNEARDVRGAILYLVAGVSAILGAGLTWLLLSSTTTPSGAVTRSVLSLAPSDELAMRPTPSIAISPDGRSVVYVGRSGDTTGLYLRRLEELEAKPIEGTAGGEAPFFSPDGQWVGFQSGGTLTKVSLSGGAPVSIARLGSARAVARAGVAMAPLFSPMDLVQGYRGSQRTAALSVRRVRAYRDLHSALFGRRRQVNVLAVPDLENDDDELGLRGTVENPIASHPSYAGMFRQDPSFPAGPDVYRALGGTMFGFGRRPPEPIVPRTGKSSTPVSMPRRLGERIRWISGSLLA